jgi:hypothetical protein
LEPIVGSITNAYACLLPNQLDSKQGEWRTLQEYKRKTRTTITAVKLDLDTEGFSYQKWGGTQRCKRGDWLVNNQGDTYTIDAETFDRTYRIASPGVYEKASSVWAEKTDKPGTIHTKEGTTDYKAGDYLVFNDPDNKDGYAMAAETFNSLYEAGA